MLILIEKGPDKLKKTSINNGNIKTVSKNQVNLPDRIVMVIKNAISKHHNWFTIRYYNYFKNS